MRLILTILVLSLSLVTFGQRGKMGNVTISSTSIVNEYTTLSSNASVGSTTINVANSGLNANNRFSGNLVAGDLILIIQMQGVSVDNTNSGPLFGSITNYNNCGNYEFVEVAAVPNATSITIRCGLQNNYTSSGRVQVIRVPRYNNLTVTAQLTAQAWNGTTGGVLSVEVLNTTTVNSPGVLNVSGLGFRGGVEDYAASGFGTWNLALTNPDGGGLKGEGLFGFNADYDIIGGRYANGAVANAGGGGNNHNAGGGGGANAGNIANWNVGIGIPNPIYNASWGLETPSIAGLNTSGGGRGGYSLSSNSANPTTVGPNNGTWGGDSRRPVGGFGGRPLNYSLNKLFLGGGGGSGDANNTINVGGHGGNGGGIILIKSYGNVSGTGSITANGTNGINLTCPSPPFGNLGGVDGSGGGGAGGTVVIESSGTIGAIPISANGGNGGNVVLAAGNFYFGGLIETGGPGGAGGGGYIGTTNVTGGATNVAGGNAGTTNSTAMSSFPVNGATNGGVGQVVTNNSTFNITAINDTICSGTSTTLTATISGTLPVGSSILWFDGPNGNFVGAGANFTTGNLFNDTTFYVGVCPGNFTIPVSVIMGVSFTVDVTGVTIEDENCGQSDGSITDIVITGGALPLSYEWNNVVSATLENTNLEAGSYSLFVADANGCGTTVGPFVVSENTGPTINATNLVTTEEHCNQADGTISGITATGANPLTYEFNGNAATSTSLNGLQAGNYTFSVTDAFGCESTFPNIVVNASTPLTIDSTNLQSTIATCGQNNGDITGLTVAGGSSPYTYTWNGISSSSINLSTVTSGTYTLVITDAFNCSVTSNPITIDEGGFPTAGFTINANPTILGDTTFFNNTASADVVSWYYYSDNGYTFSTEDGSYLFPNRGIYTVCQVVTNGFGCQDSICLPVSINELIQEVQIPLPNIITPNNDGSNDVFFITGNDANHNITIFNRWGQIIFKASPYLNNWNGEQSNGNTVPEGTYYYVLESVLDAAKVYNGFVNVNR